MRPSWRREEVGHWGQTFEGYSPDSGSNLELSFLTGPALAMCTHFHEQSFPTLPALPHALK